MKQTLENITGHLERKNDIYSGLKKTIAYVLGTTAILGTLACIPDPCCGPSSTSTPKLACPGGIVGDINAKPQMSFDGLKFGDAEVKGFANNIDARINYVVVYAKTNDWYIQPTVASPRTNICSDGSWKSSTYPWNSLVALLVDQTYSPAAKKFTDPTSDKGVVAWVKYP